MNYNRSMPDWQQFSTLQSGESDRQTTSNVSVVQQQPQQQNVQANTGSGSNVNSHLFSLDCLNKSQNEASSFYGRSTVNNAQQSANSPLGQSHPLPSQPPITPSIAHHMSNCVGHNYGTGINVMEDGRLASVMSEDIQQQQRNVQMSLSSPTSRMNINNGIGSLGSLITGAPPPPPPPPPLPPSSAINNNRQNSYVPCKGVCCQGSNIGYRWEKINPYQPNNSYRDTIHPSSGSYSMDGRSTRYRNDIYRKENIPNTGFTLDQQQHQQQQQHHRYRKETGQISRNYHQTAPSSVLPPNYPSMQNYGFSPAEYQKYYAGIKDYGRSIGSAQTTASEMMKYGDPSIAVTMQEKYLTKQNQYQTANGAIIQNGVVISNSANMTTAMSTPYFNPQLARDLTNDYPCKTSDSKEQDGRLAPLSMPLQSKHLYQQKFTMQRLNIENHLREFSRIPGYQNHPKYQEYLMKYRESIRLQQNIEYQSNIQPSINAPSQVPPSIPPINLQFDQNGVLINSSLIPGYNPNMQTTITAITNSLSPVKESVTNVYDGKAMQVMEHTIACMGQQHQQQHIAPATGSTHSIMQASSEQQHSHEHYLLQRSLDTGYETVQQRHPHQHQQQQLYLGNEIASSNTETQQRKISKDFADKPDLDVRQFLANWDETEEEDGMNGNLQNVILTDSTPIVVLEYENLNLPTDTSSAQTICVSTEKEVSNSATVTLALPTHHKPIDESKITDTNVDITSKNTAEQRLPATVNIIRCITSSEVGCDEVPTIHIVDTLENEEIVNKIEGTFHNLNSVDIKNIEEFIDKSNTTNSINKDEKISLSFINTPTVLQSKEISKTCTEKFDSVELPPNSNDVIQSTIREKKDTETEKGNLNLGNGSFVSDDTRNHDDLSLSELPTSECTPISTTLNTPNHSDNEESSERVRNLNISTNSMEIMPNSPMINFTHSPIKFQKTSTSDELQFDFQNSNEASSMSVLKDSSISLQPDTKDINSKGIQDNKKQILTDRNIKSSTNVIQSQEQYCGSEISSQVFEFSEFSNSSIVQIDEASKIRTPSIGGNCLTNIIKEVSPTLDLRVLDSDDDLVDKVNDIWMDMNLDGNFNNSSIINGDVKFVINEEKQIPTHKLGKIHKTSLRHFRKTKSGTNTNLEKKSTDILISNTPESVNMDKLKISRKSSDKERGTRKSLDFILKNLIFNKTKKRSKSVELNKNSNYNQDELLKEFKNLKRKQSLGHVQNENEIRTSNIFEYRNLNNNNNNNNNNNVASSVSTFANINIYKNASLPLLPDTKTISDIRHNLSSVCHDSKKKNVEKLTEEINSKHCVDSDIKIELSNTSLQIQNKKNIISNNNTPINSGSKEAIKIEINVSSIEGPYSYENEIINKSNQDLNILLPSSSPINCKVDYKAPITTSMNQSNTGQLIKNYELMDNQIIKENKEIVKEVKTIEKISEDNDTLTFQSKNTDVKDIQCFILENKIIKNDDKKQLEFANELIKKLEKKESDIENAFKKLDDRRRNKYTIKDKHFYKQNFIEMTIPSCSKDLDFDNFDVEPFDDKSDDYLKDLLINMNSKDHYHNHNTTKSNKTVGYFNPLFHLDELENLNTVPVYTTKDGKIKYSPNPNYTYRALIIEARQREGHFLFKNFYDNKVSLDKKNRSNSSLKTHEELSKFNNNKKYSKSSYQKYRIDGMKSRYSDETCILSFENSVVNEAIKLPDKDIINKIEEIVEKIDDIENNEIIENYTKPIDSKIGNSDKYKVESIDIKEKVCSPVKITCPSVMLMNVHSDKTLPTLDEKILETKKETDNLKNVQRCIFDLQNLKDDILKKLNDQLPNVTYTVDKFESRNNDYISSEFKFNLERNEEQDENHNDTNKGSNDIIKKIIPNIIENEKSNFGLRKKINNEIEEIKENAVLDISKFNDELIQDVSKFKKSNSLENVSIIKNMKMKKNIISKCIESKESKMKIVEINIQESLKPIDLKEKSGTDILEPVKDSKTEILNEPKISHNNQYYNFNKKTCESSDKNMGTMTVESMKSINTETKFLNSLKVNKRERNSDERIQSHVTENIMLETTKSFEIKCSENMKQMNDIEVSFNLNKNEEKFIKNTKVLINSNDKEKTVSDKEVMIDGGELDNKTVCVETLFSLPCSIDKKNFSSELCNHFIKQEKLYAARADILPKTIPKIVIRKSETNPKIFSKAKSIDNCENLKKETQEVIKNTVYPKIPKMIIRNARSRPTTPSIEEISEVSCSSFENESKTLKVRIKLDDRNSEILGQRSQNTCDSMEAKIPKMKIKLEEKLPRVVIETIDINSIEQQKTVPKMKITNVKGSLPKIMEKQLTEENNRLNLNSSLVENNSLRFKEKINSKIRLKRHLPTYVLSSELSKKRNNLSNYSQSKKAKRLSKEEACLDANLEDTQLLLENDYKQKNNNNSFCSLVSTKIPKVIIKRTSPSAEFKCELSKEAIVNAQPQVVLRRSWVLDCMAKDLRHMKLVVKVASSNEEIKGKTTSESNELQWKRFISGLKKRRELSRSNSTSDLNLISSPKIKRRRTSDYTIDSFNFSNSNSSTRFAFRKKKSDGESEILKITRRASFDLEAEIHSMSTVKTYWKLLDENMNSKNKMNFERNFKSYNNKRTKIFANNKNMESIMEVGNSFGSDFLDLKDNLLNQKNNSNSNELNITDENNELLDKDVDVREEEIDGTLYDFETNENSIIKIESSDESQTTIEILPASPDLNQEIDIDEQKDIIEEQQIYSEDTVPMHFDYELEVGENATDPLAVPVPSLETEIDKTLNYIENKQIPNVLTHEQLVIEHTSCDTLINDILHPTVTNSNVSDNLSFPSKNCTLYSCTDDNLSVLKVLDEGSSTSTIINDELYPKYNNITENTNSFSYSQEIMISEESEENFKFNNVNTSYSYSDLLVKKVLAAKETLKKYLGKLSNENAETYSSLDLKSKSTNFDAIHLENYDNNFCKIVNSKLNENTRANSNKLRHNEIRGLDISSSSIENDKYLSSNELDNSRLYNNTLNCKKINHNSSKKSSQMKFYKIPRISKSQVNPLVHTVEKNLRNLQNRKKENDKIEAMLNHEASYFPPLIKNVTSNDEIFQLMDQVPMKAENVISRLDESNFISKNKAVQLNPEITISNIVRELVFHDKATIRHRRYCMLCERWFPSTLRHRRHLAGYQHRHTELTQRRAIHMLFLIFTGKLCPKLLPPNITKTDCVPGELTPLQIAVQDFATVFDGMQLISERQSNENKK